MTIFGYIRRVDGDLREGNFSRLAHLFRQRFLIRCPQVLKPAGFSLQHLAVMFKADGLLVFPFETDMRGDRLFSVRNFHPVYKRFQPQGFEGVFTGNGVFVGFKLNQSGLIYLHGNEAATFREMNGQVQPVFPLFVHALSHALALPGLGMRLVFQAALFQQRIQLTERIHTRDWGKQVVFRVPGQEG